MSIQWPDIRILFTETRKRREAWLWDGIVPKNDLTLVAAYMKKGKTTLLTGLVNAALRKGYYCGRNVEVVRKVLYLAPEEGDTLNRRFMHLGLGDEDSPMLTVVPRGDRTWDELVKAYRMRQWPEVVSQILGDGYELVVLDGLHTMLHMFEPQAKEDNEGVGSFMSRFALPFGSGATVVATLHTKKMGGDPRYRVPPEESIRGASAWLAHPGQILVVDWDQKADVKTFHAFGRYEGSKAHGMVIRYNQAIRDYTAITEEEPAEVVDLTRFRDRQRILDALNASGGSATLTEIQSRVEVKRSIVLQYLRELEVEGIIKQVEGSRKTKPWVVIPNREIDVNSDDSAT